MKENIIDLANLPFPKLIDELDFETLLTARKQAFIDRFDNEQDKAHWMARAGTTAGNACDIKRL